MTPAVVWAIVRRPRLWWPALRAALRLRRDGGVLPSREWWEWRLHTAYGDGRRPRPEDVVEYLEWTEAFRRSK